MARAGFQFPTWMLILRRSMSDFAQKTRLCTHLCPMFQAAMGWTDSHLHQFRVEQALYGMHIEDYPDHEQDEKAFTVIGALGKVRRFLYLCG